MFVSLAETAAIASDTMDDVDPLDALQYYDNVDLVDSAQKWVHLRCTEKRLKNAAMKSSLHFTFIFWLWGCISFRITVLQFVQQ